MREQSEAEAAIVIVIGGKHGDGFQVQAKNAFPPSMLARILRAAAASMDGDVQ